MNPMNQHRCERAKAAMLAACEEDDFAEDDQPDWSHVAWLMADLRHYCDANNISFHECCDLSYKHYVAEIHSCPNCGLEGDAGYDQNEPCPQCAGD